MGKGEGVREGQTSGASAATGGRHAEAEAAAAGVGHALADVARAARAAGHALAELRDVEDVREEDRAQIHGYRESAHELGVSALPRVCALGELASLALPRVRGLNVWT